MSFAQSKATLLHRTSTQEGISVSLRLAPDPGWHVYWRYPGDSGAHLKTNWACDGVSPGTTDTSTENRAPSIEPTAWPIPEVIPTGPLANYGYKEAVNLPFTIPCNRDSTQRITVDAEWLACQEECIPQFSTMELVAPWNQVAPNSDATDSHFPSAELYELSGTRSGTEARIPLLPIQRNDRIRFIPDGAGQIVNAAPQRLEGSNLVVSLAAETVQTLSGLLVFSAEEATPVSIALHMGSAISDLAPVLLAAFVGGLILNIMPCVFPVLGLKIYQLVSSSPRQRRLGSMLYATGVCISMLMLGGGIGLLRSDGIAIGWGTQLQNPTVVYTLVLLFVLLGCNLLGIFEFGSSIQSAAGKIRVGGPLMDGLLTVLVATPCTAPFMAGAVAAAFALPMLSQLIIFFALGLGVATPVLLVGLVPGFARILPKPGMWMERFKQFLAWPLFGSAAWLLTVLIALVGIERATAPLFGIVILCFLVWIYGIRKPRGMRRTLYILLCVAMLTYFFPAPKESITEQAVTHVPYSALELARLRKQGTPVFLDVTATWCITCQSNKKLVLHSPEVTQALVEHSVVWMEADWTEPNEEITNLLGEFGRAGVPLNVYFPSYKEPVVFSTILTTGMVLDALAR